MTLPQISVVGSWAQEEFAAPRQWLSAHVECRLFPDAPSAAAAFSLRGDGRDPDAILLVQSRAGQISQLDVERLFAAAPLARFVGLVGPWCEGELRSGQPWKGVVRIPWRSWATRLPGELCLAVKGETTARRLPRTANETERLEVPVRSLSGMAKKTADVLTTSRETFDAVKDALHTLDIRARWQLPDGRLPSEAAEHLVIDGWENVRGKPAPYTARGVLLLHFPRPDDFGRASKLELNVVAQPLLLADLAAALATA